MARIGYGGGYSARPAQAGVKLHPETGLPEYPRTGQGIEGQLVNVGKQLATTAKGIERSLGYLEGQFAEAFEAEDRRQATRDRLAALSNNNTRRTR